jgi:hypothetical protein
VQKGKGRGGRREKGEGRHNRALVLKEAEEKLLSHRPSRTFTSFLLEFVCDVIKEGLFDSVIPSNKIDDLFDQNSNASPTAKSYRAITLLSHGGLGLLEDELKEQLNYDIKPLLNEDQYMANISYALGNFVITATTLWSISYFLSS